VIQYPGVFSIFLWEEIQKRGKRMTVLVTGCAGFIGSNFVEGFLEGGDERQVIGLDYLTYSGNLENLRKVMESPRFVFLRGDVCDTAFVDSIFEKNEIDGVIHFAAESHVDRSIHDPQVFLRTNILGTQVLLDAAKKIWFRKGGWRPGKKFLQVSTDEVYGSLGPTGRFSERTPIDPHSPYSASKASADLFVKAYFDTFGMPVNITRCSNNYGPYQFPEKLIPLMIRNALAHNPLPVYGDGKQVRDWIFVSDHCHAIELVFEKGKPGEVFNVGGNSERENMEIIVVLLSLLRKKTGDSEIGKHLIQHVRDRLGHDRRYAIDSSKIARELNWEPEVPFEEGLERTVDWYLENREWMENVISGEYLKFYEKNYGETLFPGEKEEEDRDSI